MSNPLTPEEVEAEVRKIAAEFPDFLYKDMDQGCVNRPTKGNPNGCIIGFAFRRLGHSVDHVFGGVVSAAEALGIYRTGDWDCGWDWLSIVQWQQDHGYTWSEAVHRADERSGAS